MKQDETTNGVRKDSNDAPKGLEKHSEVKKKCRRQGEKLGGVDRPTQIWKEPLEKNTLSKNVTIPRS